MTVHRVNNDLLIGSSIALARFPILLAEHIRRYPTTGATENAGLAFIQAGLNDNEVAEFVRGVCAWGGYAGIGGRILQRNALDAIGEALREAYQLIVADPPQQGQALARINRLHSLGTPSFASKHLRFLRPEVCPVYDSVLRDGHPYPFDPDGYKEFSDDCRTVCFHLQNAAVVNPIQRLGEVWYVADVEAALFVEANGWVA